MTNPKHLTIQQLSAETGIAVRTLRTLTYQRKLPVIVLGYRTHFYRLEDALAAINKFQVESVA